jgi:hypothetical protein
VALVLFVAAWAIAFRMGVHLPLQDSIGLAAAGLAFATLARLTV